MVVEGVVDEDVGLVVVGGAEVEVSGFVVMTTETVELWVVLGIGVVGHGTKCVSTLQDKLQ